MTDLLPGGSSPFNLTTLGEALARRMTAAFEQFRLSPDNPDKPEGEMSSVTIYVGSVKGRSRAADGSEAGPQFPLVIVKPAKCIDDDGEGGAKQTLVHVDFLIGTRRIGNDGFLDVTAIAERIRTNLLRDPVIENRARMEFPLASEVGEDDAFPQWFGVVSATFNIPQPVEEIPNE